MVSDLCQGCTSFDSGVEKKSRRYYESYQSKLMVHDSDSFDVILIMNTDAYACSLSVLLAPSCRQNSNQGALAQPPAPKLTIPKCALSPPFGSRYSCLPPTRPLPRSRCLWSPDTSLCARFQLETRSLTTWPVSGGGCGPSMQPRSPRSETLGR